MSNDSIYCCECKKDIIPRKITGKQAYPHRMDLFNLTYFRCDTCRNFVGTHKGTEIPLGVIANKEIKRQRMIIHSIIDPIWKNKTISRKNLYSQLSKVLGREYHTAELKSMDEIYLIKNFVLNKLITKGQ